jgi:hypothetical protein
VTGDQAGEVFKNADITFGAFAAASNGIKETLEESPSTLTVLTDQSPAERAYFAQLTNLMIELQPGSVYLPEVADDLAVITVNGVPAFNHLSRTTPKFTKSFIALGDFAKNPQVELGFKGLGNFLQILNQPLAYVTPAQTQCNYVGLFARNIASAVGGRDGIASWLRFSLVTGWANPFPGANTESGSASANANFQAKDLNGDTSNFLNSNPYPSTGQNNICAAGNEVTLGSKTVFQSARKLPRKVSIGDPPGIKSGKTTQGTGQVGAEPIKK